MSYTYSNMFLFHPLYGKVISLDKLMDDAKLNDHFIYNDIKKYLEEKNLINTPIYDDFILLKNYTFIYEYNYSNKKLYLILAINNKYSEYCILYKMSIALSSTHMSIDNVLPLCFLTGKINMDMIYNETNIQQYTNNYIKIKTTSGIFYVDPVTGYYRAYKDNNPYLLDNPVELTQPNSVAYNFNEGNTQFYYADDKYMMGTNKDQDYDVYLKYDYMDFVLCISYGLDKSKWFNLINIKFIDESLKYMGLNIVNYRVIFLTDKNIETNNFQYNFDTETFENNLSNVSEDIWTNDYTKVQDAINYIYNNYLNDTNKIDEFAEQHINEIYGYLQNHYNDYNTHIFYLGDPDIIEHNDPSATYDTLITSNGEFFYHITTDDSNNLVTFSTSNSDNNCYGVSNISYEDILVYEINKNRNKHLYYDENRIRHGFYVYKNNDELRETYLNLDYYFYLTGIVYNELPLQFNVKTHEGQTIQYRWLFSDNNSDIKNDIGNILDITTIDNFYIFRDETYNGTLYYKCIVKNNEYDIIYKTDVYNVNFHNLNKIEYDFTKIESIPSRFHGLEFDTFELNDLGLKIKKDTNDMNIPYIKIDLTDLGLFAIDNLELSFNIRFSKYKDIQSIPKTYIGTTNDTYTNGEFYYFNKEFYKYLVIEFYYGDTLQCKTNNLIYENDDTDPDTDNWLGDDLKLINEIDNMKIKNLFILNTPIYKYSKTSFDKDLYNRDITNTSYDQYNYFDNIRIKFKTTKVHSEIDEIEYSNYIDFILEQFKMIYHIN